MIQMDKKSIGQKNPNTMPMLKLIAQAQPTLFSGWTFSSH
jgi:hypothetical protein